MKQGVSGADYEAVLRRFGEDARQRARASAKLQRRGEVISRGRRIAGVVCFLVALVLAAVVGVPNVVAAFGSERPYVPGPLDLEKCWGLDACVAGLLDVRHALDHWLFRHGGQLPGCLSQLEDAPQVCPGCGSTWNYKVTGKTYAISCPHPGEHGRAAVFLDHRAGPPHVLLDAGAGD